MQIDSIRDHERNQSESMRDCRRVSQRDGYGKPFVGEFISEDDSVNVGVNVFDSPLNGFSLELEK